MRCSQLETRLNDVLDRRDDPRRDAEIVAHTADCPRCRRLTATYVALAFGAEALREPPTLEVPRYVGARRTAAGAILALAAALTAYVTGPMQPPPQVTAPAASPVAAKPMPDVAEMARHTGRVYVEFVRGTARGVDEAFVLASSVPPPNELLNPVLFPDDGVLKQFGAKWAPVAGETYDALERVFSDDASRQL